MNSLTENHKEFIKNNRFIFKSQQRLRSEKHNVFTAEVNKIVLNGNGNENICIWNKRRANTKKKKINGLL